MTADLIRLAHVSPRRRLTDEEVRLLALFNLSINMEASRNVLERIEALEVMHRAIQEAMVTDDYAVRLAKRAMEA